MGEAQICGGKERLEKTPGFREFMGVETSAHLHIAPRGRGDCYGRLLTIYPGLESSGEALSL